MNKKMITLVVGVTALLSVPMMAQAADVEAGRDAFETCRGCHTSPGTSNVYPTYYVPKVGGQVAAYTVAALKAYQKSERPHRTMMANVHGFSDQKLENIAAYLETVTGSARANANGGNAANGKKLAESCMACHNDNTDAGATNPRLAGQHQNYLEKAMQDYQSGARKNALMQSMVQGLSEDEINDIAAYFTSLKGLTAVK